jgi:hypothetical protein
MNFSRLLFFPLLAVAACGAAPSAPSSQPPAVRCAPENFPDDVVALVKRSPLVFRGTVVRAGATAGFAPDPSTVVVRVDRLFADKPGDRYVGSEAEARVLANRDAVIGGLAGEEVTLIAKDRPPPATGYQGYFFAESSAWGQSALLTEIARRDTMDLENVLPRLRKALLDAAIADRMIRADAVIVGEVTLVDTIAAPVVVSEHDPRWTEALVQTTKAIKGSASGVTVRFSASNDVCCFTRPKLAKGEVAIFLLHKGGDGAYYADTGNVLPLEDEERLRAVLACPPIRT